MSYDFEEQAWRPNCTTPDCENKMILWGGMEVCWPCGVYAHGQDAMIALFNATHPWPYEAVE